MNTRPLQIALLALLAACSAQPAPDTGPPANARMTVLPLALEPPPVYALIGYRDRLELTSQQVTQLDSIATSVQTANSALIDSLQAKAVTSNRAPGVLQVNPTERPLLQEIRDNTRRAVDQVEEVLTSAQETEVCELYEPDRPTVNRQRRPEPEDAFRRGVSSARNDSSLTVRGFSVWPWCNEDDGEARDSTEN